MAEANTTSSSATARDRAFVKMFEIVDASSWTYDKDGAIDDLRPLLLMMDIGSCASAEKHTSVNCVTASMGDVVIEHYPRVGELLELHASPVDTGNTSLNIAVTVFAHGCVGDNWVDFEEQEKENDGVDNLAQTKRVCEAFFTYVTTRGPNGEKRFVPPLEDCGDDDFYSSETTWERTIARFRKQLIRSEQCNTKHPKGYTIPASKAIFESNEVVLPSHQNHMQHLFGGVVMGWMCKSVQAACVKATRLPLTKFKIRSIQRVDFPTGAEVSDHVFLRPRITAIFDEGKSAEVEVMVGKRRITKCDTNVTEREEITMNFGYFYVSGISQATNDPNKTLSTSVAPFARLLRSRSARALRLASSSMEVQHGVGGEREITAMAHRRRAALLARRHLLGSIGEPCQWDSSLQVQAPILTILSVLRLCDEYRKSNNFVTSGGINSGENEDEYQFAWKPIHTDGQDGNQEPVWWTYGDSWGHHNTVVIHSKTIISRRKLSISRGSTCLQDIYRTLCGDRSKWDPFTLSVNVLEQKSVDEVGKDMGLVYWDVAEYEMKASETAHTSFCLLRAGSYVGADGSLLHGNGNDDAIPTCGVLASRSVKHERSSSTNRVLPSGFLLKAIAGSDCGFHNDDENEFLEITYVAEHDFDSLRQSGAFGTDKVSDDYIVCFLASCSRVLLASLASMDHTRAN